MAAAIEVDGLLVRYGTFTAVDGVGFTVEPGEVVTLLGPNGAGKTTTVETLEGYRRPDAGQVRVLGFDPVVDRVELAPRVGVMPQAGGVYPGIRCVEMLQLYAGFHTGPRDPTELLDAVGLGHRYKAFWRELSGGEQQRLSLALALIGHPEVVFLDEPTAGVDINGRQLVRGIIDELADNGVAVLVTTHDLAEAERIADRLVIIDHGHVVAAGTLDALTSQSHGHHIRFGAAPELDLSGLQATMSAHVTEESPGAYRVDTDPTPSAIAALTAWLAQEDIPLADLHAGRQRLEDLFVQLTVADDQEATRV